MAERLSGARIKALRRRSKYILIDTDRDDVWLIHLGMSGRVTLDSGARTANFHHHVAQLEKHDHVFVAFETGDTLTYNDPRRFGAMDVFKSAEEADHPLIRNLGPEPLGNRFNADYLFDAFRNKKAPVKSSLLDQRIIAGLGNIYVCEALWRSGIHPARHAGKIARPRIETLATHIRNVLEEAIAAAGSSLQDYRQADGELGYFQYNFAVYGQEERPCQKQGCDGVIKRIVQSGRSSFYCNTCQR